MAETSILILTKNGEQDIGACLEAIFSQKGMGPLEVIVIDSGSTDATLEIARRYRVQIKQIPPEAFHHARTRNFAADLALGEFLVFLSQDAVPASPIWLKTMISDFRDSRVGAAYGRQLPKPGSTFERQDALDRVYGDKRIVKESSRANGLGYRHYHFSDVNAAIRKDVWRATRFPEHLKVFEDLGIAKRILDGGWRIVYEPDAPVYHSHQHTTLGLFKRYFDIGFTFRQLEIWDAHTRSSMLNDLYGLLRRKLERFDGNGNNRTLSTSVQQDLTKSIGFLLGVNEHYLPRFLKRRLSAFGVYE